MEKVYLFSLHEEIVLE
ncbi:unnamed protein product, partial [Rotaria magnacalcarata]